MIRDFIHKIEGFIFATVVYYSLAVTYVFYTERKKEVGKSDKTDVEM